MVSQTLVLNTSLDMSVLGFIHGILETWNHLEVELYAIHKNDLLKCGISNRATSVTPPLFGQKYIDSQQKCSIFASSSTEWHTVFLLSVIIKHVHHVLSFGGH